MSSTNSMFINVRHERRHDENERAVISFSKVLELEKRKTPTCTHNSRMFGVTGVSQLVLSTIDDLTPFKNCDINRFGGSKAQDVVCRPRMRTLPFRLANRSGLSPV
eukprot:TRINITY_DN86399_c0_g1_i1.p1 TRINITY_DN86399_c0_g1~~TRINITY_DN86399_c0_g1_i1.p1  ORF type:complete len:106 (-),score=12.60 TRINITY_DN86399_c0_g1_i1:61-378(-)